MKKYLSLLIAAIMMVGSLCACSSGNNGTLAGNDKIHIVTTIFPEYDWVINVLGDSVKEDEASGNYYFACIIADATACCSQGIEFVLTDDYTYPDDYPEEGGDICVIGVFDTSIIDAFPERLKTGKSCYIV